MLSRVRGGARPGGVPWGAERGSHGGAARFGQSGAAPPLEQGRRRGTGASPWTAVEPVGSGIGKRQVRSKIGGAAGVMVLGHDGHPRRGLGESESVGAWASVVDGTSDVTRGSTWQGVRAVGAPGGLRVSRSGRGRGRNLTLALSGPGRRRVLRRDRGGNQRGWRRSRMNEERGAAVSTALLGGSTRRGGHSASRGGAWGACGARR